MATPRRTSARIRAKTPGKTPEPHTTLGSLIERDESPSNQQSLNAAVSRQNIGRIPGAFESDSFLTTPSARPEPDHENMHPSKIHQSTTKETDEGLMLGFTDIKKKENVSALQATPSKSKFQSPGFDFKFANAEQDLTEETQRIMESVRAEAAKIRLQKDFQLAEQARKDEEAEANIAARKIAQPKTRFSDAHKAQFSKMESIANHPSVMKAKKIVPTSVDVQPKSLKRTQSKADLSDDRPQNLAPTKRAKATDADDVSTARPVSRDGSSIPAPPKLPSCVLTPTKASLARSASAKSVRNTKIPGSLHSKSIKGLVSPKAIETVPTPKKNIEEPVIRSLFGLKKSISMKSILAKPQPKYSDDPIKIAAGTHLPLQDQPLGTPIKAIKRVGFAEDLASPTPVRLTGLRMPNKVLTPFRKANDPVSGQVVSSPTRSVENTPTRAQDVRSVPEMMELSNPSEMVSHPDSIASSPTRPETLTSPSPRKIAVPVSCSKVSAHKSEISYPTLKPLSSNPPQPGDFTFRADHQIRFGPMQTIRTVRPSGVPTTIAPLPHGMPGKKRARPEDDEDEDRENRPPENTNEGSPSKRLRVSIGKDVKAPLPTTPRKRLSKLKPNSAPVGSGKKGLSLSRLNFLARPKNRA